MIKSLEESNCQGVETFINFLNFLKVFKNVIKK